MSAVPIDFVTTFTDSAVSRGLKQIENQATTTGKKMAGALQETSAIWSKLTGLAVVGAIGAAFRGISEHVDQIQDLSGALNISTTEFQQYTAALAQGGVEGDAFARGIAKLNDNVQAARNGNETARKAFDALGITWQQLNSESPIELLGDVAEALATATDKGKATAAALDLLGAKQLKLVNSLMEGRAALEAQAKASFAASKASIDAIDKAGDNATKAKAQLMALATEGFGSVFNWATKAAPAIDKFVSSLPGIQPIKFGIDKLSESQKTTGAGAAGSFFTEGAATAFKAAQPTDMDPREWERLKELDKQAAIALNNRIKAEEKAFEEGIKRQQEMVKVNQKYNEMQRAFQIDHLEGESKLRAMEKDRATIADQIITAGEEEKAQLQDKLNMKDLEIAKEKQLQREKDRANTRNQLMGAQEGQRSRLLSLQSSALDYELMSPDERRESRRESRRVKRAQGRLDRVQESRDKRGGRGARPGENAAAKEIDLTKTTIDGIAAALAKLVPHQNN